MTKVQVSLHPVGFIGNASHLQVLVSPTPVSGVIVDSGASYTAISFATSSFSNFISGMGNSELGKYVWRIATWGASAATPVVVNIGAGTQSPSSIDVAAARGPVMPIGAIEYFRVQNWNETVSVMNATED